MKPVFFKNKFNKTNILILSIIFLISLIRYYYNFGANLSKSSLSTTVISAFCVVLVFLFTKEKNPYLNGNYLRISHIFVAGYFIVHFFAYAAFLFTDIDFIVGANFVDSRIINEAAINSLVALISFILGYLSVIYAKPNQYNYRFRFIKFEYIAFFFLLVFCVTVDRSYFQGGYSDIVNEGGGLSVISSLSQQLAIAAFVASSISKIFLFTNLSVYEYIRSYSLIYYAALLSYLFLVASSGDRGPLIQLFLCYFATYFIINKKRFTITKALPILVAAVLVLNFLGAYRQFSGGLTSDSMVDANLALNEKFSGGNIIFSSTTELSNVVRSYNVIYEETKKHGTISGLGFMDQLLGFFPGLRPYVIYPIFQYDKGEREIDTNYLSTRLLSSDHGMGTTCCADIFYNFGFFGTIIVFFFFGKLVKKMDLELYAEKHNILLYSFAINYLMLAVYLGRGKLLSPLNISLYSFLFIYLSTIKFKSNHE